MIPCEVIGTSRTTGRKAGSQLQLACWGHCGTPQCRLSGWLNDWKSNIFPHTEQLSGGDPVQCPLICWMQVVCVPVAKMKVPWACGGTCTCYLWSCRKLQVLTFEFWSGEGCGEAGMCRLDGDKTGEKICCLTGVESVDAGPAGQLVIRLMIWTCQSLSVVLVA